MAKTTFKIIRANGIEPCWGQQYIPKVTTCSVSGLTVEMESDTSDGEIEVVDENAEVDEDAYDDFVLDP